MDDPAKPYSQRSIQHEPDQSYPDLVRICLEWVIDGRIFTHETRITSEQFFGANSAPMDGVAIIALIERMRRAGPIMHTNVPNPRRQNAKPSKKRR